MYFIIVCQGQILKTSFNELFDLNLKRGAKFFVIISRKYEIVRMVIGANCVTITSKQNGQIKD